MQSGQASGAAVAGPLSSVLSSDPLIIPITIHQNHTSTLRTSVSTHALVDSGASGNFIDTSFAKKHLLVFELKLEPTSLYVIDGRPIESGLVTHFCDVDLDLQGMTKSTHLDATQLGTYPVILGMPWLRKQNPMIDWRRNCIVPHDPQTPGGTLNIKGLSFVPSASVPQAPGYDISWIESHEMQIDAKQPDSIVGTLLYDPVARAVISATSDQPGTFPENIPDSEDYKQELLKKVPSQYHDQLSVSKRPILCHPIGHMICRSRWKKARRLLMVLSTLCRLWS